MAIGCHSHNQFNRFRPTHHFLNGKALKACGWLRQRDSPLHRLSGIADRGLADKAERNTTGVRFVGDIRGKNFNCNGRSPCCCQLACLLRACYGLRTHMGDAVTVKDGMNVAFRQPPLTALF